MIGAFMAILNIQITNASLLDIEGGIGTGVDNGAWVSTAYLIGEIVVIPLTDYMSRVFSFRRYVLANAILFPLFSIACSFTHDLGSMIVMRGLQGFTGGILIPVAFTMVLTKLPKHQQPIGLAIFALSVTFAPAIGPTIGGYMTENFGWQTIFYINAVPSARHGARPCAHARREPDAARPPQGGRLGRHRRHDDRARRRSRPCSRKATRTIGSASPFILRLAIIAAVFLTAFVVIELKVAKPLVNLRLLKQRNFGIGVLANTLVGFALFGSVYILPQYLGQVQHYNAEQIGNVLAWTGLPQLMLIPLVPMLMKRFDVRYIACLGIAIFAASCFMNTSCRSTTRATSSSCRTSCAPSARRLVITPISAVTTAGIAPKDAGAASGLSNMMRNLGGAVGTATLGTILTKREQFHSNIIGQSITLTRDEVRSRLDQMTDYFMAHGVSDHAAATAKADCRARRRRQAAGPDHGLQRHVRRHRRPARHRRRLDAPRPQAPGRRRSGRPLNGANDYCGLRFPPALPAPGRAVRCSVSGARDSRLPPRRFLSPSPG